MINKSYIPGLLLMCFALISCFEEKSETDQSEPLNEKSSNNTPLFELLPVSETSIDFNNTLTENINSKENLFDFDYFYNGAGVGIEDLNNDGLLDIFFTANQVENRLYINKGDFNFEDITESSGININKYWSNGITFVDINDDGFKDIYISQGGPKDREQRKNLLYINQGDLTFKEEAEEYGLADMGISTQSAFFDFDKDGDLDCIVMNENELYGFDPINFFNLVSQSEETKYYNSSHIYENRNGSFIDITKKAGVLDPIFGLGLVVSDFNNDNYLDFYIASDYYLPDALYINNQNGGFINKIKEYTNQISFFGMGMDVADINNDSREDIFVLDMASTDHVRSKTLMASMSTSRFDYLVNKANFHHQYMFNSLQLNIGNNKYNNVAQMTKVAKTDWSWAVLMTDFDNDEDKDIFVTNGYRRYALDNDFRMKVFKTRQEYNNNVPLNIKQALYYEMPSEKLGNILFENESFLKFKNNAAKWGLDKPSYSNGAAYGDLDNDGDLDLVINNIDENAFVYKNLSDQNKNANFLRIKLEGTSSENFAKVRIDYGGKQQFIESKRVRGFMSSVADDIHFGLGKHEIVDTLLITWPSGKSQKINDLKANSILTLKESEARIEVKNPSNQPMFDEIDNRTLNLDFAHKENDFDDFEEEILLPYKQSNLGPFMATADLNSDDIMDLFFGGAAGQVGQVYLSKADGTFSRLDNSFLKADAMAEDNDAVFFDIDNDGDLDLYVVSGGNEFNFGSNNYADRLYLNVGDSTFKKIELELSNNIFSGKKVVAIDYNKDGFMDLIVGNRIFPRNYPKHAPSLVYKNNNGSLEDVSSSIAPDLENFGIINDILVTDFNDDGWMDFIALGEWTGIGMFKNEQGVFKLVDEDNGIDKLKGWWFSISETDINNDGLKDYIVGNVGKNIKFKASTESPFKVYANDFDSNGTNDIVLSNEYNGNYVPVRGRECSSQQMPYLLEKFPTFSEFANATLTDIYGNDLEKAYYKEVNSFDSYLLINQGNGKFIPAELPLLYQSFPIQSTVFYDINKDGFEDAIVAGNIYETEVETPRLDCFTGFVMLSNGKDGYTDSFPLDRNLQLKGNIKSMGLINIKGSSYLMALPNNDQIQIYKINP